MGKNTTARLLVEFLLVMYRDERWQLKVLFHMKILVPETIILMVSASTLY